MLNNNKRCSSHLIQVLFQVSSKKIPSYLSRATIVSSTCNVIISKDHNIFSNLAFEQWLYSNLKFAHQSSQPLQTSLQGEWRKASSPLMLIWRNHPALVIGRHQNPWLEGRPSQWNKHNVQLARRQSGGGCVYHDMNNINISLIGHRDLFNRRQENLQFVAKLLDNLYGIKCEPTHRHDLVISDTRSKITGSAAKLGRFNCYHHYTLLVNTDTTILQKVIRQDIPSFLETKSSSSVRSRVQNLKDIKKDITPEMIIDDLANSFSRSLIKEDTLTNTSNASTIQLIQPNESDFPGFNQMKKDLMGWKWVFGMTPKFILRKKFEYLDSNKEQSAHLEICINRGLFEKISITLNHCEQYNSFDQLIGEKFSFETIKFHLTKLFQVDEHNLNQDAEENRKLLFATFLLQLANELFE